MRRIGSEGHLGTAQRAYRETVPLCYGRREQDSGVHDKVLAKPRAVRLSGGVPPALTTISRPPGSLAAGIRSSRSPEGSNSHTEEASSRLGATEFHEASRPLVHLPAPGVVSRAKVGRAISPTVRTLSPPAPRCP